MGGSSRCRRRPSAFPSSARSSTRSSTSPPPGSRSSPLRSEWRSTFLVTKAVLASANRNKLEELRAALPDWEIEPLVAEQWPAEDGTTYEENARLKAVFGRGLERSDAWVLGEDSGIECAALDGAPGLHSARW